MAAEEGDYGDLGSGGLLTVEKRDHEWHEGHEWESGEVGRRMGAGEWTAFLDRMAGWAGFTVFWREAVRGSHEGTGARRTWMGDSETGRKMGGRKMGRGMAFGSRRQSMGDFWIGRSSPGGVVSVRGSGMAMLLWQSPSAVVNCMKYAIAQFEW